MRLFVVFLFIECAFGWRLFGRGGTYNSYGGLTASRFYGGQFPYYNQPFYPRYQQGYVNGPYGNSYAYPGNYRLWQRNGVGYYGPDSGRYPFGFGAMNQGFNPYKSYQN